MNQLVGLVACAVLGASLAAQCANVTSPGGSGCGGFTPFGIPISNCSGAPAIGNAAFALHTTAPCFGTATGAVLLVGVCRAAPIVFTTGFGPGGLCGPSQATCALFVDALTVLPGVPSSAGGYSFAAPIPALPQLVGLRLCVQSAVFCSGTPCTAASNAVSVTLQ